MHQTLHTAKITCSTCIICHGYCTPNLFW